MTTAKRAAPGSRPKGAWDKLRTKAGVAVRTPRVWADVAVAFTIALTTAQLSVLIGDIEAGDAGRWVPWVFQAIFLAGLLAALIWRQILSPRNGTLYYVSLLAHGIPDFHDDARHQAERDSKALRMVRDRVDMPPGPDVVDAREATARIRAELQRCLNDDDHATGFHLAPNMFFPCALSVGYDLDFVASTEFVEFDRNDPPHPTRWEFEPDADASPEIGTLRSDDPGGDPNIVLVDIHLVPAVYAPRDLPWARPGTTVRIGVLDGDKHEPRQVTVGDGPQMMPPGPAARAIAAAVAEVLTTSTYKAVILRARLPKTVAVALGWYLSNRSPGPGNFWSRLITVGDDGRRAYLFRVRNEQADPLALLAPVLGEPAKGPTSAPPEPAGTTASIPDAKPGTVELINLTPHALVVFGDVGPPARIAAPSGTVARVVEERAAARTVDLAGQRVPLTDLSTGQRVRDLPPARDGVLLAVSRVTAAALARDDLVFPLDEVRDGTGRIIGCRGLGRFRHAAARPHDEPDAPSPARTQRQEGRPAYPIPVDPNEAAGDA